VPVTITDEMVERTSLIAKMAEFVTHRGRSSYSVLGDHHAKCALQAIEEAGFRVEPAAKGEPVAWVTADILAAMKRGERVVPGWKYSADFCIPLYAHLPASKPAQGKE
jgi:hypothetical protein